MKHNIAILCLVVAFVMIVGHLWYTTNDNVADPIKITLPDLVDKTLPAIVMVRPGFSNKMAAGVLVSEDGWIVTARHIVENRDVMLVTMADGTKFMSTLILESMFNDIAFLKIDVEGVPYVEINKMYPRLGETVYAIGHPLGIHNTVSLGIVSNVDIDQPIFGTELIMIDAEITRGNSGGGLFDMDGRLIGVVVAVTSFVTGIEANLVVPISKGRELLDEYLQTQKAEATCDCVEVPTL